MPRTSRDFRRAAPIAIAPWVWSLILMAALTLGNNW